MTKHKGDAVFKVPPQDNVTFLRRVSQFVVTFVMIHNFWWFLLSLLTFYYIYSLGYGVLVILLVTLYLPSYFDASELKAGRPWHSFRTSKIWELTANYYGLEVIRQEKLDPEKQYIFGYCPHGIMILSRVASYAGIWERVFPGIETRVLAATALFRLPCTRDLCLWMGAIDASRKSAEYALKKGLSLIVYPGGSKEVFNSNPSSPKNRLVLKDRKGFIKLAIKQGAQLVPTYVFGEKWMYSMWRPPRAVWKAILRVLRVPLIVFWGRFGTWMPYRKSLGIVYGKPIAVKQDDNPSDEQVEKLHKQFMDATEEIFNDYKAHFGYKSNETIVVE